MTCARRKTILLVGTLPQLGFPGEMLMVAPASEGIDLFKIAGRTISGWVPSLKTDTVIRQPFCSQLEECLLLWLEYHPLVKSYARGDIGPAFANTYRLPIPQHAPFAIGYTFEDKPHHYLPDVVGTLSNGQPFIAEAGMEDDKRGIATLPKRRPHVAWLASNGVPSGLEPSARSPASATTIWSSCMPGVRRFPPLPRLP